MDKLKLDIQKFALNPPTAGNIIDEVCLYRYHQNIKRYYAKKGSDNNFANLVVDSIRSKNLYNKNSTYVTGGNNQNISNAILLKPNTNYYFKSGKGYTGVVLYDSNGTQTRSLGGGSSTTTEIGFKTQSNEVKAILTFYSGQSNVDISTFDFTGIQLETGSTATTYSPYQNLNPNIIKLDMMDDTSGATWQDMMKNKLDYCINNINTTKVNVETFINGGWNGVNYGFGVFSKIGIVYQLVWFSSNATYYCRKLGDGTYQYTNITGQEIYSTTETIIGTWIDGKPIYRQVIDKTGTVNANTWFTIKAMPNVDNITYHYIIFDYGITGSYLCRVWDNNFEIYVKDRLDILKVIVEYTKTTD